MKILSLVARVTVLQWSDTIGIYGIWLMMIYLTNVWDLSITHAAGTINVFCGLVMILPLGMRFLADSLLSNYWILVLSCTAFSSGLGLLSMSTPPVISTALGTCSEYNSECIGEGQKALFYAGLVLTALGLSGHVNTIQEFLFQDQIPHLGDEVENSSPSSVMTYLFSTAGLVIYVGGFMALSYIKPWSLRFGIPAICSVVATIIFLSGSCSYKNIKPNGRLYVDTIAFWETKFVLRMIPMCMPFIMLGVISAVGFTYYIQQADKLDRKVGSVTAPLLIMLYFYAMGRYLWSKCNSGLSVFLGERRAAHIGMVFAHILAILSCITAARVEDRRLGVVRRLGLIDRPDEKIPMSMFWLVPQLMLIGGFDKVTKASITDIFAQTVPFSMDNYMVDVAMATFGLGMIGGVLCVHVVGVISERGGRPNWFQHTLNMSRLDNYYWTLSAMAAVNLVFFILVAFVYRRRDSTEDEETDESLRAPINDDGSS